VVGAEMAFSIAFSPFYESNLLTATSCRIPAVPESAVLVFIPVCELKVPFDPFPFAFSTLI